MDFVELGHFVANIRKQKKISQQLLANDLHISRATISSFESGKSVDIGLKKVLQILDYLGLEIDLKEKTSFPVFEELLDE
ncbi:helix-turn-helix domain-containing protein [Sulfurimonas sp.]|uniref:helix-turn-helix domain-containing protein n=1 Tax=Sulfurimonas sp. TaxID=2022749 RepID=UPI003D124ECB